VTTRNRVFIGILLAYALGVAFLLYRQLLDIDPRYRESAEDSLVETAQLLATAVEQASNGGALRTDGLDALFRGVHARPFRAEIYGIEKTRVDLRVTVVDASGRVVYDSTGRHAGEDHARWHDVALALRGEYGARTTPDDPNDENSTVMHVAAPIRAGGRPDGAIVGAVSVGKPVQSFGQFVEAARRKTLLVGLTSVVAVILLAVSRYGRVRLGRDQEKRRSDYPMEMLLALGETDGPIHVWFQRPGEEERAAASFPWPILMLVAAIAGGPSRTCGNHYRFPLQGGSVYSSIRSILALLEEELSGRDVTVHFGWPTSRWLDRMATGVFVANLLQLPQYYPGLKFAIEHASRAATVDAVASARDTGT